MTTDSLDFSWLENVPCRTRKNIQWSTLPRVTSGSAVVTSKLTSVSSKMSSTMTWSKKPLAPFNHNRTIANLSPILPKKRFLVPLTPSKSCECLTPKTPSSVRRYSTVWKFYDFTCTQILCEIRPWVGILGTKARKKRVNLLEARSCSSWQCTVWKFWDLSVTQILREINFGISKCSKNVVFVILGAMKITHLVNFNLQKVQIFTKII